MSVLVYCSMKFSNFAFFGTLTSSNLDPTLKHTQIGSQPVPSPKNGAIMLLLCLYCN